jgi:hypothetical protein
MGASCPSHSSVYFLLYPYWSMEVVTYMASSMSRMGSSVRFAFFCALFMARSLDVLPSPRDKWSAMTHPPLSYCHRIQGHPILYGHFYFNNGCVLLTHAYATGTTATTIRHGGNPRGSTELDEESGHNCRMSNEDHHLFVHLVLRLD